MMLVLAFWLSIALLGTVSVYAVHHLAHLPYAPECPTCRATTAQPSRTSRMDRVLARFSGADTRRCPRCGWSGRMRWRLAAERARRR